MFSYPTVALLFIILMYIPELWKDETTLKENSTVTVVVYVINDYLLP